MTLRRVAHAVADGGNVSDLQHLMSARQTLIENAQLAAFSKQELPFLVSAALYFCSFSNVDIRANGLYMLLHLAANDPTGSVRDEVFRMLEDEPDRSILEIGYPWFERHWGSLNAEHRSLVELCALRDPTHFRLYFPHSDMFGAGGGHSKCFKSVLTTMQRRQDAPGREARHGN